MNRKKSLCGILASVCYLSSFGFAGCSIANDFRNFDCLQDVHCVQFKDDVYYNTLVYELNDLDIYYWQGEEKRFIDVTIKAVYSSVASFYICNDEQKSITDDNKAYYKIEYDLLTIDHFSREDQSALHLYANYDMGSVYSKKYNCNLYGELQYKLKEKKTFSVQEKSDTYLVTYYTAEYNNAAKTSYTWLKHQHEYYKSDLKQIIYRSN